MLQGTGAQPLRSFVWVAPTSGTRAATPDAKQNSTWSSTDVPASLPDSPNRSNEQLARTLTCRTQTANLIVGRVPSDLNLTAQPHATQRCFMIAACTGRPAAFRSGLAQPRTLLVKKGRYWAEHTGHNLSKTLTEALHSRENQPHAVFSLSPRHTSKIRQTTIASAAQLLPQDWTMHPCFRTELLSARIS